MAARVRSPRAMAVLLSSGVSRIEGPWQHDMLPIWMLGKEGLAEDLLVSLEEGAWAQPYDVSRAFVKSIADRILPPGIDDNTYAGGGESAERAKLEYRDVWCEVLDMLPESSRPAAFTTGNFGYYAERELAAACEHRGIPFIAMHKECFKAPGRIKFFGDVYERRGAFKGRRILVYNEAEKALQVSSGIFPRDGITVTGMPRLDRIHTWRKQGSDQGKSDVRTLLAFGFTPQTGLPRIPRKTRGGVAGGFEYIDPEHEQMSWSNLFEIYHDMLVRIAHNNRNARVIVKLKGRNRDAEPSISAIEALGKPYNMEFAVGGDPLEFLSVSNVVCGFNTTALLEGVAAGLPVFVPQFEEAVTPGTKEFVPDLGAAVFACRDCTEMENGIQDLLRGTQSRLKQLPSEKLGVLDKWLGNADGQTSKRVRAAFEREFSV